MPIADYGAARAEVVRQLQAAGITLGPTGSPALQGGVVELTRLGERVEAYEGANGTDYHIARFGLQVSYPEAAHGEETERLLAGWPGTLKRALSPAANPQAVFLRIWVSDTDPAEGLTARSVVTAEFEA